MPSLPKPTLRRPLRRRGNQSVTVAEELGAARVEVIESPGGDGGSLKWVHFSDWRSVERDWLAEHYDFHALDYEDLNSRNQRPKVDEYSDYLFIVLQFPRYDKELRRLSAAELDVFVGADYVITITKAPLPALDYLFERCESRPKLRDELFGKGAGYLLYRVVDDCVDAGFPMLRKIGNKLERLENDVFEGRSNEVVRDIFTAKQEVINFRSIVRPMRPALADLERTTKPYMAADLDIYFEDINDASERVSDMLENFKEVVEALEDTNESVLSHELNTTLRVLTAISLVLLPLTLIASIFGMNVKVPGQDRIDAFWLVVGVMAVILVGIIALFRRRGIL